jgi:hypothetical protein
VTGKPGTGLRRPSSVSNLRAAAASQAPLEATAAPPPDDRPRAAAWPVRVPLNVDEGMRRALEEARVEDRIETTARIRAMIHLWQSDAAFRERVNELARGFRPGARLPRRLGSLPRNF